MLPLLQIIMLLLSVGLMPLATALTRVLIFTGLPGEESYTTVFSQQSAGLADALRGTGAEVELYAAGEADKAMLRRSLQAAESLAPDDQLIVIYVGHGSYDGRHFKLNLRGPDVTGSELDAWLDAVAAAQLLILTSASSGAVLDVLADERRTLVTATRSGDQSNVTVFGQYLTAALEDPAADLNKDRQLSLSEVYELTARLVADHYENRRLIATEHPQLVNALPGFTMSHLGIAPMDPVTQALLNRRADAELAIAALKDRKADLTAELYFQELQQLLLDLALIEREIEQNIAADPSAGEL